MPISGTTKLTRLEENRGATGLVLAQADLTQIKAAADEIAIVGERYPEVSEKLTGR